MSWFDFIHDGVEGALKWLSRQTKQDIFTYCDLESADDETVLISKDSSLVSLVKIEGAEIISSLRQVHKIAGVLDESLKPFFHAPGHTLQVFYQFEPRLNEDELENQIGDMKDHFKTLGFSGEDILASRKQCLKDTCTTEVSYWALWTSIDVTDVDEGAQKKRIKHYTDAKLPDTDGSQKFLNIIPDLRIHHKSYVGAVLDGLKRAGIHGVLMESHEAVNQLRRLVAPEKTAIDWKPRLPGDALSGHIDSLEKNENNISDFLWAPLDEQILLENAEVKKFKTVEIEAQIYSTLGLELFPQAQVTFYDLFNLLMQASIPWRISYQIQSGGLSVTRLKSMLAQFLAFSSYENKLILNANHLLKNIEQTGGDAVVRASMLATTWSNSENPALLKQRNSRLVKALQAWGNSEITTKTGDPFDAFMSNIAGMKKTSPARVTAAPLKSIIPLLPISMPAKIWSSGALQFRTIDGKLWPYQPGSDQQISWVELIYAKSGSGKSVLLNAINFAMATSMKLDKLPMMGIIDIGASSKGMISLLQTGLPEDRAKEVQFFELNFDFKNAINPFDTHVGSRKPTAQHKFFLSNFVSLLMLDNVEEKLPDGMESMISLVIDLTYEKFADDIDPKLYSVGMNERIDACLHKHHISLDQCETWWRVTDILFELEEITLARIAQRYAVPLLSDTIAVAQQYQISDLYGNVHAETQETYIESFNRKISAAIRQYPFITLVSQIDVSSTRVLAIDLSEISRASVKGNEKGTALGYMLARFLVGQSIFIPQTEDIAGMKNIYHSHYQLLSHELKNMPKRLVYDEFHRTAACLPIRLQVMRDMREGRKHKIQIALASQSISDFSSEMLDFATSVFILGSFAQESLKQTVENFALTEEEKHVISNRTHGPSRNGVTFLGKFQTKVGSFGQMLNAVFSPVELWALTTTVEDAYIRDELYASFPAAIVRRVLAEAFPSGSALSYLLAKQAMKKDQSMKELTQVLISSFQEQMIEHMRGEIRA